MSRTVCQGLTVLRINRWWGPIRPTTLNFCLSNIDSVPNQNQLDHFDHAFADLCVTGYASTTPPPLALIELRAAVRATLRRPSYDNPYPRRNTLSATASQGRSLGSSVGSFFRCRFAGILASIRKRTNRLDSHGRREELHENGHRRRATSCLSCSLSASLQTSIPSSFHHGDADSTYTSNLLPLRA